MMSNAASSAYHPSFGYRTTTEFNEPLIHVHGYTEPELTPVQHLAVVLGSSGLAASLRRPISRLESFSFLADVPGETSRVYMSDKRAQFFRALFTTRWFSGASILWGTAEYGFLLSAFLTLRDALPGNGADRGCAAGAFTGVGFTVLRHPYDVLRATAEAEARPKVFRSAFDVLRTALRERPVVLFGLYRGWTAAAGGRAAQYGAQFGLYDFTRRDGAARGTLFLFLYAQTAAFVGLLLQYPFLAVRQQLRGRNRHTRGGHITCRAYVAEVRRQHGITMLFDGFFRTRPFLQAAPSAVLLTLYDVWSRHYTERLHPGRKRIHAEVGQSLYSARTAPYAETLPPYEFRHHGK